MAKRKIMRSLKMLEISGVDRPAQVGARAVLMKRAWEPTLAEAQAELAKGGCCLTSDEEGHSHLVDLTKESGETSWGKSEDSESGHSHPYVVSPEGKVTIGAADGHSHKALRKQDTNKAQSDVPAVPQKVVNNPTDTTMSDTTTKAGGVTAEQFEKMQKDLARATALAGLNDAQKAHLAKLDAAGQDSFLKLDAAGRDAEVAKAAGPAADQEVYKDRDGNVFTKRDVPRLVAAARRSDLAHARAEAMEKRAKDAEFTKRAGDELGRYPGELVHKAALLEAIDGIADPAARSAASQILKAGNEALGMAFSRSGTASPVQTFDKNVDPAAELDRRAAELVKANPALTIEKARVKVLETPEGDALYAKMIGLTV